MSIKTLNVIATGYEEPKIFNINTRTTDKVELFKKRIIMQLFKPDQQRMGINLSNLCINGIETKNDKTIDYYAPLGVNWSLNIPAEHLKYLNRTSDGTTYPIKIKTLDGKELEIEVSKTDRVEDLKKQILSIEGTPIDQQRLIYGGKQAEDHHTMDELDIVKDCTIHMVLRFRGGANVMFVEFADVSNNAGRKSVKFSETAPAGRQCSTGTNIEITCSCKNYPVICQRGYGIFDLLLDELMCPLCHGKATSRVTVGYVDCRYRMHGIKADGTQFSSTWVIVEPHEQYVTYDPQKSGTINWTRLIIESKERVWNTQQCEICLNEIDESVLEKITCGHYYHRQCLENWGFACILCPS